VLWVATFTVGSEVLTIAQIVIPSPPSAATAREAPRAKEVAADFFIGGRGISLSFLWWRAPVWGVR
jgi:hypothetical protein